MLINYPAKYRFSNSLRIMISLLIFIASVTNCLAGGNYCHYLLKPLFSKNLVSWSLHSSKTVEQQVLTPIFVKKTAVSPSWALRSDFCLPQCEPGIWPIAASHDTPSRSGIISEYNFLPRLMELSPNNAVDLWRSSITDRDLDGNGVILLFNNTSRDLYADSVKSLFYVIPMSSAAAGLTASVLRIVPAPELSSFRTIIVPKDERKIFEFIQDRHFSTGIIFIQFNYNDKSGCSIPGLLVVDRNASLPPSPKDETLVPVSLQVQKNQSDSVTLLSKKNNDEIQQNISEPLTLAEVALPPPTVVPCVPELIRRARNGVAR